MNKSIRSARRLTPFLLALAVLMSGITLPGYSLSSAARRRAERGSTAVATRLESQSGTSTQDQHSVHSSKSSGDNKDEVTPANHIPEPRGKIAFASDRDGNFEIYSMNPDGSGQIRLTNDPAEDVQPTWSPDGARIAFVSNRTGNNDIYIMNADGTNVLRLINNPANERSPAWAPSGQNIAFVSDQTGNDEIYTTIIPSSPIAFDLPLPPGVSLSDNPADDIDPTYAPDGSGVAFASNRDGDYEIYVVDAAGTRRLTTATGDDVRPAWSPGQITFQSGRTGNEEIFVMDPNGGNQFNVTSNAALEIDPARTRDNTRIAFASSRDGNLEIYAGNAPGAALTRLTVNEEATDFNPAIQPLAVPADSGARLFTAMLDGSQEVPPNSSTARGVGIVMLSADEATARVSLTFSGLSSPQTMAHIHGFAIPGVNAPIIFPLPNGSFSDFQIALTPIQVRNLKAGLLYFNVHTQTFPGGEIRGQINAAPAPSTVAPSSNAFALTAGNRLLRFNTSDPDDILMSVAVTGLQSGETLLGIDLRPANGQLYGLGNTGRLYTLNPATGAATQVGTSAFAIPLSGSEFGFDFNPTVDRIRIVSDNGQNLRVNPDTGAVVDADTNTAGTQADATLVYAPSPEPNNGQTPRVSGAAYTNNFMGATTATLYDIDYNLDVLVTQDPPNAGVLNTVGALGVDTTRLVGFDIANNSGAAFAALTSPADTVSRLYAVALDTGRATLIGDIGGAELIRDIAVAATVATRLDAESYTVQENAGRVTLTVTRGGDLSGETLIDFDTNDGTASERRDYTTAAGVLRFAPGEGVKGIEVFITDDRFVEQNETFTVTLRNPTGAAFISPTTATVTIIDNDTVPPTTNPIDASVFFVTQHYLDFLNRTPDAGGLAAWVNVLNNCSNVNNNPACDRVTVSSAFFRSPEFQTKGFYAIRFYLASLGRLPTYREFIRDTYRLNGATAAESIAARAAFADEFTGREEFAKTYDALSNAAYVDRLIQTTGVAFSNRDALVADLNAGTKTRAQVLREIVESAQFATATFNRAFVLSQYFGYLRRDPDMAGFNAWLTYLNANPGDFRTMVNGFVNSIEYRLRFGQP